MKKFIIPLLLLAIVFATLIAACDRIPATTSESGSQLLQDSTSSNLPNVPDESSIIVEIKDLNSDLNNWHRFSVDISHNTDKYLTAEVYAEVRNAEGVALGSTTVFINNLGSQPIDWESIPFLAKASSEYFAYYEVISYQFTDGYAETPEITTDNVKDYIRLTVEDYGDVLNDEKQITANIHNLTSQYFSGKITFIVKDSQGSVLEEDTQIYDNLEPYTYSPKLLWFPIVNRDAYSLEYSIDEYVLSDDLIP